MGMCGTPDQQRSDTSTATITPLRMPRRSTAAKATIDTLNSKRLTRHGVA